MKQWLLIGFVMLTGLQGNPVWLAAENVVSVSAPAAGYPASCNTLVTTMSNSFCVTEKPADVVSKLENSK